MIRRFHPQDGQIVSELIGYTLQISNSADYSKEYIARLVKLHTPEYLCARAEANRFYVVEDNGLLVGCGGIGTDTMDVNDCYLFNIFVMSNCQGHGYGRLLMAYLEKEALTMKARRILVHASITACAFYQKLGYRFADGGDILDNDGLYSLYKMIQ